MSTEKMSEGFDCNKNEDCGENRAPLTGAVRSFKERSLYQLDYLNYLADRDYQANLDTLRSFKFYDPDFIYAPSKHPSMEQVKKTLKEQMTPAQADIVRMMNNPVMQIVPHTNYDRYTDVFTNFRSLAESGWVQKSWDAYDGNKDRNSWASIEDWEIAVTDDTDRPLEGDAVDASLCDRMKWFDDTYGRHGFQGMDFRRYMMLAMTHTRPDFHADRKVFDIVGMRERALLHGGNTLLNGMPQLKDELWVGSLNAEEGFVHLRKVDPARVIQNVVFKPTLVFRPVR